MTRWLTIVLLLCVTAPVFAQVNKKEGKRGSLPLTPASETLETEKEDESRVVLAFDPGSHTRPILALAFNKDQTQLITVGADYTIQIWSATSGERLDILRLPAFGRDNGFDVNRWNQAAISADGAYVAIGGGPKLLYNTNRVPTRLLIIDVARRKVRKIIMNIDLASPVTCLDFSANGDRLAIGIGGVEKSVYLLDNVHQRLRDEAQAKPPSQVNLVFKSDLIEPINLALSASGNKLVTTENRGFIRSFDVKGPDSSKWTKLGQFEQRDPNDALEWSPDESYFVWSWRHGEEYSMESRSAEAKPLQKWSFKDVPGFEGSARVSTFQFLDPQRLYLSTMASLGKQGPLRRGATAAILDLQTGQAQQRFFAPSNATYLPYGTASATGTLAATTSANGLEAVIYRLTDGKTVATCGSRTPVPTIVGWAKDSKSPAIAWSEEKMLKPWNATAGDLHYAFDLTRVEPTNKPDPNLFDLHQHVLGDWKLTSNSKRATFNYAEIQLQQGDKETTVLNYAVGMTLVPNGANAPLLAHSMHDKLTGMGSFAELCDSQGTAITSFLPAATHIRDMVSSPDGRYLLMSTGTHRLSIYRTDGSRFPFLNLVQVSGQWVAWMPEGYYAASPGGEKLIGWAENKGPSELAVFHPVEKFATHFRRPDIIKLAFEKGSLSEALKSLQTKTRAVEEILPPQSSLKLLSPPGGRVLVEATAIAAAADRPVVGVRLFLDGKALILNPKSGVTTGLKAVSTWEIDVPAGPHQLILMAKSEANHANSEPLILEGPKSAGEQRVLHRLCVGISNYALPALNLTAAAKDAQDVFAALEKHCVGTDNHFDTTRGTLLTDQQATRLEVGKAIVEIRKTAKPGDLVVFMFAGHGIKQQDDYYLLTHEGDPDPSQSLKGKSLSGADLRNALQDFECPVLLILDSCFSAKAVKAFRPATDDLTRSLTEDAMQVTVLSAAMAHEKAKETQENGHFTAALLKALEVSKDTPYNRYDNLLYTHHIYDVIFSEVRHATDGQQNPFLHRPTTMPPFAVRRVPGERTSGSSF